MEDMTGVTGAADSGYYLFTANVTYLAFVDGGNRHIRTLVGVHDIVTFGAFCSLVFDVRKPGFWQPMIRNMHRCHLPWNFLVFAIVRDLVALQTSSLPSL